jgi:hypothetical protein
MGRGVRVLDKTQTEREGTDPDEAKHKGILGRPNFLPQRGKRQDGGERRRGAHSVTDCLQRDRPTQDNSRDKPKTSARRLQAAEDMRMRGVRTSAHRKHHGSKCQSIPFTNRDDV